MVRALVCCAMRWRRVRGVYIYKRQRVRTAIYAPAAAGAMLTHVCGRRHMLQVKGGEKGSRVVDEGAIEARQE